MKEITQFTTVMVWTHRHPHEQDLSSLLLSLSYIPYACQCLKATQKERTKKLTRHTFYPSKILKSEGRHHVSQLQLGKHDINNVYPNAMVQMEAKAKVPNSL